MRLIASRAFERLHEQLPLDFVKKSRARATQDRHEASRARWHCAAHAHCQAAQKPFFPVALAKKCARSWTAVAMRGAAGGSQHVVLLTLAIMNHLVMTEL